MTRRDYVLLSSTVAKMKSLGDNHLYVADMIAQALAEDNPRFEVDRFLKDCGLNKEVQDES